MLDSGRISGPNLKKAIDELTLLGVNASSLAPLVSNEKRGRPAPRVGDSRTYSAQELNEKIPFVRVPLDTLGIKKTQKVRVHFDSDMIIISKI